VPEAEIPVPVEEQSSGPAGEPEAVGLPPVEEPASAG